MKGTRDKEKKSKTKKQRQHLSCSSYLKQRDREHERTKDKSKSEIKKTNYKIIPTPSHPLSSLPHLVIKQPTPPPFSFLTPCYKATTATYPFSPLFVIIDKEFLPTFWRIWESSMKFWGKMCFETILKVRKKQGSTLSHPLYRRYIFQKTRRVSERWGGGGGDGWESIWPPQGRLGLRLEMDYTKMRRYKD